MIKRIGLTLGSIAVVSIGSLILTNSIGTKADDTVTVAQYNELVSKVEALEIKLNEANTKIEELANSDVTINQKLDETSNKTTTNINDIKTLKTNIDNNSHKISNITDWQIKLSELTRMNVAPGAFVTLENFRKNQQ